MMSHNFKVYLLSRFWKVVGISAVALLGTQVPARSDLVQLGSNIIDSSHLQVKIDWDSKISATTLTYKWMEFNPKEIAFSKLMVFRIICREPRERSFGKQVVAATRLFEALKSNENYDDVELMQKAGFDTCSYE